MNPLARLEIQIVFHKLQISQNLYFVKHLS